MHAKGKHPSALLDPFARGHSGAAGSSIQHGVQTHDMTGADWVTRNRRVVEESDSHRFGLKGKPTPQAVEMAREAGLAFLDADVNGDQRLSWEEFYNVVPDDMKRVNSKEQIRDLFDSADADKSGQITIDEYFVWTLSVAAEQSGTGLESLFRRYDSNGTGTLDADEFAKACGDINFGAYAHEVFLDLDMDNSGCISYHELMDSLKKRKAAINRDSKRFLTQLSFQSTSTDAQVGRDQRVREVDTSEWRFTGKDMRSLCSSMSTYLLTNSMRVSDLHHLMVVKNGADALSREKFPTTMKMIGYVGEDELLHQIFAALDADNSGSIKLDELYGWMTGSAGRRKASREVTLLKGRSDRLTLDRIDWTVEELQRQLQLMLLWNGLTPLDLMRGWDADQGGSFSFKEFLRMLKKLVNPDRELTDLWDFTIRPVVQKTFREIAGADRSLDVLEFEAWLNRGWRDAKSRMLRQQAGLELVDDMVADVAALRMARGWYQRRKSSGASGLQKAPSEAGKMPSNRELAATMPKPKRTPSKRRSIADHKPGWEVRAYITQVASIAQSPAATSGDQRQQLEKAQRQLRADRVPPRAAWWSRDDWWQTTPRTRYR